MPLEELSGKHIFSMKSMKIAFKFVLYVTYPDIKFAQVHYIIDIVHCVNKAHDTLNKYTIEKLFDLGSLYYVVYCIVTFCMEPQCS